MNKFKFLLSIILSATLISCGEHKKEDVLLVGTSSDNPPYEFMKNGEIVGFDIDLINAISKDLGKNIEFRDMDFHGLVAALSSNNVDLVIAGMSITPERQKHVIFSNPYTNARISVLSRIEDKFQQPEDLKGKNVGSQLGTIWTIIAYDMSEKHEFQIKALANNLMLVEELKNKRLDALVVDEAVAEKFVIKHPGLSRLLVNQYSSSFAIALPKKSDLKLSIDNAIKKLKDNGTLNSLAKKWGIISEE